MQHCSHQILNSTTGTSIFAAFMVLLVLISTLIFLESGNSGVTVIGLMPAFGLRAGQKEFCRTRRLSFSFGSVESKQNGRPALLTFDAEVPSSVGFGPLRDVH
jgi:hypothetical protein